MVMKKHSNFDLQGLLYFAKKKRTETKRNDE